MKPIDLPYQPLAPGTSLIEASAGTGKTQAIAGLVLRLLLEPMREGAPLRIDQILVLTYTEAATEELRERIRTTLVQALQAFTSGRSEDSLLAGLLATHTERAATIERLRLSLYCFDLAPIFTIHGFCQRTLKDRAFESGTMFDADVLTDASALLQEIAEDFWRLRFYNAGPLRTAVATTTKLSPAVLLPLLKTSLNHSRLRIVSRVSEDDSQTGARLEKTFASMQETWRKEHVRLRSFFGSARSWGNRPYNDDARMAPLFAALDRLSAGSDILPRDLAMLATFSPEALAEGVTKARSRERAAAPSHPFFDVCGEFHRDSAAYAVAVRQAFLDYARLELRHRKERRKVLTYDDLLTRLHEALRAASGPRLVAELRRKYQAALIDEFQDTDPVQCEIFESIFQTPAVPPPEGSEHSLHLYLIGDPKQAIYGFRGADIFSYLNAKRKAPHHYTLGDNWRSDSSLVRAINTIFQANPQAFVFPGIEFEAVTPRGRTDEEPLLLDGKKEPALQIWFCPRQPGSGEILREQLGEQLPRAVAAEISRLLAGPNRIGARPLRPQDFAVLVLSHHQAQMIQKALGRLNIPSVQHTQESVFATQEAVELLRVLSAIANPTFEPGVRAALATRLAGLSGRDLHALQEDDAKWQEHLERHHRSFEEWSLRGFATMFRRWLVEMNVRPRLLASPEGERSLTNFLHLTELLHQVALTEKLGPVALTKWLATRIESPDAAADEYQLRLERDENAVQIVTVHKSKGLQYEIVFAPFCWREADPPKRKQDPEVFYHDEKDGALVRDLGPDIDPAHLQRASTERLAELVRLFYVALTRARHRCYLAWGAIKDAGTSAPAWILHHERGVRTSARLCGPGPAWRLPLNELEDEELLDDLRTHAEKSRDSSGQPAIAVVDLPADNGEPFQPADEASQGIAARTFAGRMEMDWRVTSFSWLTSEKRSEAPDHDAEEPETNREEVVASGIFLFPRGSKAGTCLHQILEEFELTEPDPTVLRACVDKHLVRHGIGEEHATSLARAIHHTLSAPLAEGEAVFCLKQIPKSARRAELEFCFALNPLNLATLQAAFSGLNLPDWASRWPERIGRLSFSPTRGFMKGFIDLICEVRGRYYLIDWKSNWLGPELRHYHPHDIQREMISRYYILQYHLYAVALHRHLELRLPDYDFDRHFGGVRYLFVRGIDPATPGHGIFSALPTRKQIARLADLLLAPPSAET